MTETLDGVEQVKRIELPDQPSIYMFEVQWRKRGLVYVVWERRDAFSGEDDPPVVFEQPWNARAAKAVDALGQTVTTDVDGGRLRIAVSLTPIFIEPAE